MSKVQDRTDGDYEGNKSIPVFLSARELEVIYFALTSCSPPSDYQDVVFKVSQKIEASIAVFLE